MIRLLAPWRDCDVTSLFDAVPQLLAVNEVDAAYSVDDDTTPAGRWLAGYFDDDQAPAEDAWRQAVASAAEVTPPPPPPDLDALRAAVDQAPDFRSFQRARIAYVDAVQAAGGDAPPVAF